VATFCPPLFVPVAGENTSVAQNFLERSVYRQFGERFGPPRRALGLRETESRTQLPGRGVEPRALRMILGPRGPGRWWTGPTALPRDGNPEVHAYFRIRSLGSRAQNKEPVPRSRVADGGKIGTPQNPMTIGRLLSRLLSKLLTHFRGCCLCR